LQLNRQLPFLSLRSVTGRSLGFSSGFSAGLQERPLQGLSAWPGPIFAEGAHQRVIEMSLHDH